MTYQTLRSSAGLFFLITALSTFGTGCNDSGVTESFSDADGDGVADAVDKAPNDNSVCGDSDGDDCDDCSVAHHQSVANDGDDLDQDGLCNTGDNDADGDTVAKGVDEDDLNDHKCLNSDGDNCDDCLVAVNPQNPAFHIPDPNNDGPDADEDGQCDIDNPDAPASAICRVAFLSTADVVPLSTSTIQTLAEANYAEILSKGIPELADECETLEQQFLDYISADSTFGCGSNSTNAWAMATLFAVSNASGNSLDQFTHLSNRGETCPVTTIAMHGAECVSWGGGVAGCTSTQNSQFGQFTLGISGLDEGFTQSPTFERPLGLYPFETFVSFRAFVHPNAVGSIPSLGKQLLVFYRKANGTLTALTAANGSTVYDTEAQANVGPKLSFLINDYSRSTDSVVFQSQANAIVIKDIEVTGRIN